MAEKIGRPSRSKPKRPSIKHFFLNGNLHRKLHINRGKDLMIAWDYPNEKKYNYSYSDVLKRHKKAFTTTQVMKMINRGRVTLDVAMREGKINYPQYTYGLDENRNFYQYFWKEEEIMDLLDYLSTVHFGRPRNDGMINPYPLPSPRELRAMINDENVLYIKQGDTYIPSWRAKDF